jgi:hypothetical protein
MTTEKITRRPLTPRHLVPRKIKEINRLLKSGEYATVKDACEKVELSAGTYYKHISGRVSTKSKVKKASIKDDYDSLLDAMIKARSEYNAAKKAFNEFVAGENL